jgi:hypothetical protein
VTGLQTRKLARIPAMVELLVATVAMTIRIVCSGILGVMPTKTPMAVPRAKEWGSPFNLKNFK